MRTGYFSKGFTSSRIPYTPLPAAALVTVVVVHNH